MKKMAICLMVTCLPLFVYPYKLNAGALAGKDNRDAERTAEETKNQWD